MPRINLHTEAPPAPSKLRTTWSWWAAPAPTSRARPGPHHPWAGSPAGSPADAPAVAGRRWGSAGGQGACRSLGQFRLSACAGAGPDVPELSRDQWSAGHQASPI